MFRPSCLSSSMPLPPSMPTFGWLVCPPIKRWPYKAKGPPISLFILSINIPPQTMGNRPPHTFQLGLASSPTHPLRSTPSSIWLLFMLIKRRPPKAKAPPLYLLFHASYSASPSEQTNDSERNPDGSRPAHGIGEQRHHDLVAPLLYPWRERGQRQLRVRWHGSSCWLLNCVCCVLCFVLPPKLSGVLEYHHISYFEKWKLWSMFLAGSYLHQSNYDQKKGTVVWLLVGINLR